MQNHLTHGTPYIYADDTIILIKSKSKDKLFKKLNQTLKNLETYCTTNHLKINTNKTSITFMNNIQNYTPFIDKTYFLNNKVIQIDSSFKYLGYHIDNMLTFKKHAKHITNKLSSVSSILTFSHRYLSTNHLYLLLNSLALCHINSSFFNL
jgi:hypothetical protein